MSVQKVVTVQKARKAQGICGSCKVELGVGDGYLWWTMGFRSNYKYKRCLKPECYPRPSERETSKAASFMAAQESFDVSELETVDEIEEAVHEVGSTAGEVRDEYQDAMDQWENGNEQIQEKLDSWEEIASELENWQQSGDSEPERCDKHDDGEEHDSQVYENCPECKERAEDWIQAVRDEAEEAVSNVDY